MFTKTAALSPDVAAKIGKMIRLLASDIDGEVLSAVAALQRALAGAGADLHELAAMIENYTEVDLDGAYDLGYEVGRAAQATPSPAAAKPVDWRAMALYCAGRLDKVAPKHRPFVITMKNLPAWKRPTSKQQKYIRDLYLQAGGREAA
jgi:hypothetical protein